MDSTLHFNLLMKFQTFAYPNAEVENHNCILKAGEVKFFIMANMKGPLQIPSSIVMSNLFAENL